MRTALPLIALMLATGAAAQDAPAATSPEAQDPQVLPVPLAALPPTAEKVCRDRIHQVRDERGLPRLDRETARPDEALLIAAVDRRIDGCSVMVMRDNLSDVRPLPTAEGTPGVQRIPGE